MSLDDLVFRRDLDRNLTADEADGNVEILAQEVAKKLPASARGQPNGVAPLDGGMVPAEHLPLADEPSTKGGLADDQAVTPAGLAAVAGTHPEAVGRMPIYTEAPTTDVGDIWIAGAGAYRWDGGSQEYITQTYNRQNILGTVSQSGGVPTGAVIERGSNANGEYVRFADGTQICWKTVQLDAASNPGGTAMFFSTISAGALEPFPAAFQEVFGGSVALETNTAQWGQVNFTPGGLSAFVASAISRTSGVTANVTIFGRWF
jgi:hypothetical protein